MSDIGKDILDDLSDKIKPLRQLEKYSADQIVAWIGESLDTNYPQNRKQVFAKLTGMSWASIRSEILKSVEEQDYEKIERLNKVLDIDLLDLKVMRLTGKVIDGLLAVHQGKGSGDAMKLAVLQTINSMLKNPKLESYLLYRRLAGKPRLSFGFLNKV